jgi:hypothetical protein
VVSCAMWDYVFWGLRCVSSMFGVLLVNFVGVGFVP